ncbi:MAG TPA: tetratricopeptide repeat protein [Longimicrobiales bacterium]|nr:tetratricopeptide repeat protein [Longimicrobiales bacterium]
MKKLIVEAHRRSLWQVLGIYLAAGWGALEAVDLLSANVGLPEWFPGFAFGLLVLGLPIVLATAFVQEAPPSADDDDEPSDRAGDQGPGVPRRVTGAARFLTWRNALVGGVGAFALWGLVAAGWMVAGGGRGDGLPADDGAPDLRSIAVLPFVTRSDDAQDRFFAEGMHDDLLTQLAKVDSLVVISRTSVMQYAETTKSIPEIAAELGVAVLLEGGVQRAGNQIRVNVQLIDARNDQHLWAETYDEELTAENIFAIQSDLSRRIARSLRGTLAPQIETRIDARPTESLEAYELFVRGRSMYLDRAAFGEDIDETREIFRAAIEADSSFADAWAGLANVELAALNWGRLSEDLALARARRAIQEALALDADNSEGLLAQARLLSMQGNEPEAESVVLRVLELSPGNNFAQSIHGNILAALGRTDEALEATRRSVELDPRSAAPRHALADRLFFAGRYAESVEASEGALAIAPEDWYGYYNLGWAHAALGQWRESVAALHEAAARTVENRPAVELGIAYAFARGQQRDSALAYLGRSESTESYDHALVFYELGDHDAGIESLERSLTAVPSQVVRLRGDPTAAAMLADPRYAEVIRRLGL